MKFGSLLILLLLAACGGSSGGGSIPPPPAITITDMSSFLVQGDRTIRHGDYGNADNPAGYYQIVDSHVDQNGNAILGWSFAPWGAFDPTHGDGGEIYANDGTTVRITATQDGGTPGMQYFVGQNCGGTGWIAFDNTAPTGGWREQVARLGDSSDPTACPPLNPAYTRWRYESLTLPFTIAGQIKNLTLGCVISEHWNGDSIATASDMEQSVWCRGHGRIWWARYAANPAVDLGYRLPVLAWPAPSERPDFHIQDARLSTNIVTPDQSNAFIWP